MPKKLLSPEAIQAFLARRFNNQHQNWLVGDGTWPLVVGLGVPTEKDVAEDPAGVRQWASAWQARKGPGEVCWEVRQFPRLGKQNFPLSLSLEAPLAVAMAIGQGRRWSQARERYEYMTARWPPLAEGRGLASMFNVLADYSVEDFQRLLSLLAWLSANCASNLYLRQRPVEGLDTKWVGQRVGVVSSLMRMLRSAAETADLHELCGLRRASHRIRVRLLCPGLRRLAGGLGDIEAPVNELSEFPIYPRSAIIVENLETGLALPDIAGTVAVMGLGNAVSALGACRGSLA